MVIMFRIVSDFLFPINVCRDRIRMGCQMDVWLCACCVGTIKEQIYMQGCSVAFAELTHSDIHKFHIDKNHSEFSAHCRRFCHRRKTIYANEQSEHNMIIVRSLGRPYVRSIVPPPLRPPPVMRLALHLLDAMRRCTHMKCTDNLWYRMVVVIVVDA